MYDDIKIHWYYINHELYWEVMQDLPWQTWHKFHLIHQLVLTPRKRPFAGPSFEGRQILTGKGLQSLYSHNMKASMGNKVPSWPAWNRHYSIMQCPEVGYLWCQQTGHQTSKGTWIRTASSVIFLVSLVFNSHFMGFTASEDCNLTGASGYSSLHGMYDKYFSAQQAVGTQILRQGTHKTQKGSIYIRMIQNIELRCPTCTLQAIHASQLQE